MKINKIHLYVVFLCLCFSTKIYAQSNSQYNNFNNSIHSFLQLNDSIKTGKIDFHLENQQKGAKLIDRYIFSLLFSKDDNGIKFNLTDSINEKQYVYNGHTLYTIDHKKKKYGARIARQSRKGKIVTSTVFILNNLFLDYYTGNNMQKYLPTEIEKKQISPNNSTISLIGKMKVSGNHVKNAKDSLAAVTDANVEIIFDPKMMILKSYRKILTDKKSFKKGTILQSEYTLLSAKINDKKYTQPQYYEGLYYARDYKPFPNDNYLFINNVFYNR